MKNIADLQVLLKSTFKTGDDAKQFLVELYKEYGFDFNVKDFKIYFGYKTQNYIEIVLDNEKFDLPTELCFRLRFNFSVDTYAYFKMVKFTNLNSVVEIKGRVSKEKKSELIKIANEINSTKLEVFLYPFVYTMFYGETNSQQKIFNNAVKYFSQNEKFVN